MEGSDLEQCRLRTLEHPNVVYGQCFCTSRSSRDTKSHIPFRDDNDHYTDVYVECSL